ncbi:hypothetical protein ACFQ2B_39580 [Streptomyces stramineus]
MSYGRAVPEAQSVPDHGPPRTRGSAPAGSRSGPRVQQALTVFVIVAALWTVRPLGLSGRGLVVAVLLLVNSVALAARHLPEDWIPPRLALAWLALGIMAAAALIGVSSTGSGYLFAYFLVGHIGVRLEPRRSLPWQPCAVCCAAASCTSASAPATTCCRGRWA